MKNDEQERIIQELESSLQRTGMEMDRKLTKQQQENEKKIQVLMHQLAELENGSVTPSGSDSTQEAK